ncbi:hypothetical protein CBM2633_B90182 [Cupriavidus taiwanensis]|nr:hypothetical protein CBM2633_B90182 [Cupriavidus taiwanensis]
MGSLQDRGMRADPHMVLDHNICGRINSLGGFDINDGMGIGGSYLKIPCQHAIATDRYGGTLATDEVAAANGRSRAYHKGIVVHQLHYHGSGDPTIGTDFYNVAIAQ